MASSFPGFAAKGLQGGGLCDSIKIKESGGPGWCGAGLTGCALYAEGAAASDLPSASVAEETGPAFIEATVSPDWKVTEHSGAALEIPQRG